MARENSMREFIVSTSGTVYELKAGIARHYAQLSEADLAEYPDTREGTMECAQAFLELALESNDFGIN